MNDGKKRNLIAFFAVLLLVITSINFITYLIDGYVNVNIYFVAVVILFVLLFVELNICRMNKSLRKSATLIIITLVINLVMHLIMLLGYNIR